MKWRQAAHGEEGGGRLAAGSMASGGVWQRKYYGVIAGRRERHIGVAAAWRRSATTNDSKVSYQKAWRGQSD